MGVGVRLQEIVSLSADYVRKKGGRPRHEVEEWIAHTLGVKRLDLYLQFDRPVEQEERDRIREGISRLSAGEPLAYILKRAPFYGYEFEVSPDVLIPRPETELIIDTVMPRLQGNTGIFVDVCTGSGCIGLSVKKLFPSWRVVLIDICDRAIQIAKRNAERLCVDVEVIQGDLLSPILSEKAGLVVCNPPYLSTDEWVALDGSVKEFEPRKALDAGETGLEIYERALSQMRGILLPGGVGCFEIGSLQKKAVIQLIRECGFTNIICIKDLAGHDRLVSFEQN